MSAMNKNNDRLVIGVIIVLAIVGLSYFWYNAFVDGSNDDKPNPFEYNIEYFKQHDPQLDHYSEITQIPLTLENLTGIAIGPEDNLYVAGDDGYLVFNQTGSINLTVKTPKEYPRAFFD